MADAILIGFLLPPILILVAATRLSRRLRGATPGYPVAPQSIPMEELALLAGGPARVVDACLVGLHDGGHITGGPGGLSAQSPSPVWAHPLSRAVYDLVASNEGIMAWQLRLRLGRRPGRPGLPAIEAARTRLITGGLLPATGTIRALRWMRIAAVLGTAVAPATVIAIFFLDSSTFVPLPWVVIVWLVAVLGTNAPRVNGAGRKAVQDAAELVRRQDLARVPGQRAVAVAVFGPAVLWRADPLLAARLGLPGHSRARSSPRSTTSSWPTSSSWWNSSGSGSDCYSGLEAGGGGGGFGGFGGGGGDSGGGGGGGDSGGSSC